MNSIPIVAFFCNNPSLISTYEGERREINTESFSIEFWLQIVASVASISAVYGKIAARILFLEQKMDKHNGMMERIYRLEESDKNAHMRIDELREDILR